jgi:acyl dehydratase
VHRASRRRLPRACSAAAHILRAAIMPPLVAQRQPTTQQQRLRCLRSALCGPFCDRRTAGGSSSTGSSSSSSFPVSSSPSSSEPVGGDPSRAFDEWSVGQRFHTTRRTVSDSDIITFVQLSGYQAENLFADMEFLRSQGHPSRMAPGMLTASIADALIVGSGIIAGFAIAMIGIDGLMAKKPVYSGDTLWVELEVTAVAPSQSKPDRGVVTTHQRVFNQREEIVLEYDVKRMLKRRAMPDQV